MVIGEQRIGESGIGEPGIGNTHIHISYDTTCLINKEMNKFLFTRA